MTLTLRQRAERRDRILTDRLETLVPALMDKHGVDAWVIVSREYNEDPVLQTMLPETWLRTARRRTILVFSEGGRHRAAIARYPIGPFPSEWDPEAQPDQWLALAMHLQHAAGKVAINISPEFALADGLSATEYDHLIHVLDGHDLTPAASLAIEWLETRTDEEVALMREACATAHGYLRRALSAEVIKPGTTTTDDVAWWLRETVRAGGYGDWFHPGVSVQRAGDSPTTPADGLEDRTIEKGDLVHIDFGIVADGYHTDQQQHAYVLRDGEIAAPDGLTRALRGGNRLQDILMGHMEPGRTGNEVLADTLVQAREEGLRPIVYTHPIGLHGHAAGSTIGMWDKQGGVPGAGDYPLVANTAWSIELAVQFDLPEWEGQTIKIMLEEDAYLGTGAAEFLDGRQTELWLV